ncbi:peptidylprolyl isomerase [Butyrivibrio sp. CB08]|uniref:NifB/NifX family molybdenum-iron cluster-binding protein n=1 Tax=Butyrivibrio sp. CB08 TaxID=2364879 RepID=UPI000EAA49F1|nr:NifB/NifX family molybdenum-iron cluster-binding protein [Butyrivibrio sp. CB08]RKM60428.1 peptidylprolyl isomerase [Butyrivibrio sp. CB08]
MKIAVTYEDGQVFQHFGHTEQFKVYEVEDGKVVSSQVVGTEGAGHEALATLLSGKEIDALICGGLGGGAMAALEANGIEVVSGVKGDTDAAVEAYLKGELESTGVNCDHHDHEHEHGEGHNCGHHDHGDDHEEGGCGGCHSDEDSEGGCGGCGDGSEGGCGGCSGCHSMEPIMEGKNAGKKVQVHYKGTFNDGTQFDASYDRGEPITYICGTGMMIPGFDLAVVNMEKGEIVDVHLTPDQAYGEYNPDYVVVVDADEFPAEEVEKLKIGDKVFLQDGYGRAFPVTVTALEADKITFDGNHEMAGKDLNFKIELVDILD